MSKVTINCLVSSFLLTIVGIVVASISQVVSQPVYAEPQIEIFEDNQVALVLNQDGIYETIPLELYEQNTYVFVTDEGDTWHGQSMECWEWQGTDMRICNGWIWGKCTWYIYDASTGCTHTFLFNCLEEPPGYIFTLWDALHVVPTFKLVGFYSHTVTCPQ